MLFDFPKDHVTKKDEVMTLSFHKAFNISHIEMLENISIKKIYPWYGRSMFKMDKEYSEIKKKNSVTLMCDTIVGYLNSVHHIEFLY